MKAEIIVKAHLQTSGAIPCSISFLYSNLQGKIGPGGQIRLQIRRMVADMFSGQGGQAKTLASWLMRIVCEALTSRQASRQTDLAQPAIALIANALMGNA